MDWDNLKQSSVKNAQALEGLAFSARNVDLALPVFGDLAGVFLQ